MRGLYLDAGKHTVFAEKKKAVLMCLRPSTGLIYFWVAGIKTTPGNIMKFHLSHQLMQRKSIFVQTGRATYITVMTMQSQWGTTNEPKCDYYPTLYLKTKRPFPQNPSRLQRRGRQSPCHHSALQLAFLPLFGLAEGRLFAVMIFSW